MLVRACHRLGSSRPAPLPPGGRRRLLPVALRCDARAMPRAPALPFVGERLGSDCVTLLAGGAPLSLFFLQGHPPHPGGR